MLGAKCGLKPETMRDIISVSSGNSYALGAKLDKFIMAGDFSGGFMTDLQYKDLGLALESAKEVAMPLPMTAVATEVFEMARAAGLGREDMSSVIKVWEQLCGVEIRKGE